MRANRYWLVMAMLLVFGLAMCGLSVVLSNRGFDEYDMSPMIDSGWRVYSGQVPGRDFLVTFPPTLYLSTALFFRVFGVTWHALALGACWFYAMLLVMGIRLGSLLRKMAGTSEALGITTAYTVALTIPFIIMNVLWHSSLAMSLAIYAVFSTYVLVSSGELHGRMRREAMIHLTLASGGLLLSKANTAFPILVLCFWVAKRVKVDNRTLAAMGAGAVGLASLALAMVHGDLVRVLLTYTGLTGRLIPKAFIHGIFYDLNARSGLADLLAYTIVGPLFVVTLKEAWKGRETITSRPIELLGIGSILVTLIAMGTNFTFKVSDSPLGVMGIAFLAFRGGLPYAAVRRGSYFVVCALLVTALFLGRTKLAFQMGGGWLQDGCFKQFLDDPFFGHTKECKTMPDSLSEVDRALAANRGAHVFFGPSLEFFYAARGSPAPLHMPDWWDPGTSYPLRKADEIAQRWREEGFDLLIFKNIEDRVQMPAGIGQEIDASYTLVSNSPLIHIYRRRKDDQRSMSDGR